MAHLPGTFAFRRCDAASATEVQVFVDAAAAAHNGRIDILVSVLSDRMNRYRDQRKLGPRHSTWSRVFELDKDGICETLFRDSGLHARYI